MKIKSVIINNVNGIKHLEIPFDPQFNIICGPNGIGKTTILESIAFRLARGENSKVKRRQNSGSGFISAVIEFDGELITLEKLAVIQEKPDISIPDAEAGSNYHENHVNCAQEKYIRRVMALKINRYFDYLKIEAISGEDTDIKHYAVSDNVNRGIDLKGVKNWLIRQYLYFPQEKGLTNKQRINFELAKQSFSLLDETVSFSHVEPRTSEIKINTPDGEIVYEQLSSGFKSCLSILLGVIREVENRFSEPEEYSAQEFEGILLIDELDLHLHPEWQSKIVKVLAQTFPKMQFITTTHSPHIIQSAQQNQVIALEHSPRGVSQRESASLPHGYQGWTVEEILLDVMGMRDTRSDYYQSTLRKFDSAIAAKDYLAARENFAALDNLLHHESYVRKTLELDLAMLRGIQVD